MNGAPIYMIFGGFSIHTPNVYDPTLSTPFPTALADTVVAATEVVPLVSGHILVPLWS